MSQALYDLPEGWEWKRLRDVAFSARNTVEPLENHTYHYVGLENIQSNTGVLIDFAPTDGKDISSTKVAFKKDSVLFGKLRPYLNKVYLAEFDGIATTEIIPFQCTNLLTPKFLAHYMRTGFFINWAMANCSGARMPRATSKFFDELAYVPLPPLAEQTRIVEKLDAVLSRIDTAIDELQQSLALVDAMFESGLDGVFAGFFEDISRVPFKDLVVNLDGQRVPIKSDERKSTHGTYPYYGATGVIDYVDDYIFDGENLLISEDGANLVARKYPIAFIATGKYWVNNHAHVVCAKPAVTTNRYLQWFFAWCDLSSYITGSAQPKLSQGKLNTIPVPVPSLERQKNIVEELDALNDKTTQLKTEITAKVGMFNQLKASVLDGAFRGRFDRTSSSIH